MLYLCHTVCCTVAYLQKIQALAPEPSFPHWIDWLGDDRKNRGTSHNLGAIFAPTVDGRNPAPVDRWFIPLFIGFQLSTIQGGAGFLPSTVVVQWIFDPFWVKEHGDLHPHGDLHKRMKFTSVSKAVSVPLGQRYVFQKR